MNREIENITDQLDGFAMEVANCVRKIEKEGFTTNQAIEITKIAVNDIKVETSHHKNKRLRDIADSLLKIADAFEEKMN